MRVMFSPSSVKNSSIRSFFLEDPISRFTWIEISPCRSWSCSTTSLDIPFYVDQCLVFNLIEILFLRRES